jgi:inner membrane protein involved in colicin E2 resistance
MAHASLVSWPGCRNRKDCYNDRWPVCQHWPLHAQPGFQAGAVKHSHSVSGHLIMESLSARRLHPVQYGFAGVALILFFVLVLSLSEHIGFTGSYAVSALATSLLIAAYVWRAMGSAARGGIMLGVLLILYGLLYLILRMEDYALLASAMAGFGMLAATMFLTLGIDGRAAARLQSPSRIEGYASQWYN